MNKKYIKDLSNISDISDISEIEIEISAANGNYSKM